MGTEAMAGVKGRRRARPPGQGGEGIGAARGAGGRGGLCRPCGARGARESFCLFSDCCRKTTALQVSKPV